MTLVSRLAGRFWGLPPARNEVTVERNLHVPMPDGIVLLADHYAPVGPGPFPPILVRSPYGRSGVFGLVAARLFAERGYHVLIQSCRGTFGSGGEFYPVRNEAADGRATIEWLAEQAWFDGRLGTQGASYLGYTQWAVASAPPVRIRSMAIQVSASKTPDRTFRGGSFSLADSLGWSVMIANQKKSRFTALTSIITSARRLAPLWNRLPLAELDQLATGKTISHYQDWLAHPESGDEFWDAYNFRGGLGASTSEIHLVGGWYDTFLPDTVADYLELRRNGRGPRLVIGAWTHTQAVNGVVAREVLEWMDRTLADGAAPDTRPPVRVRLGGSGEWLDFDDWPPPADQAVWCLQTNGGLAARTPAASEPDRYRYDPADPTPAVGGPVLNVRTSGPKNNRRLESRPDVLVYTSDPLTDDLDVVGPIAAELFVRSSLEHTDFFARLCDVDGRGRSVNVSDGLRRLRPEPDAHGIRPVRIEMWPVGHRFKRGHRLRLQVSSGAHPRFARNLGTGEPLGTGRTLNAAEQEVFHDPEHPSAVLLPVLSRRPATLS
ncbi:MAG: CocE/NonD family hydrolase [Candidatus Dormibacteria bacterium]